MHSVFIVDNEQITRERIRRYLQPCKDKFSICGETGNVEAALSMIRELQPEILIIDIMISKMNGLELMLQVKVGLPKTKIIVVCGNNEYELVQNAYEIGADKSLLKPIIKENLIDALNQVAEVIDDENIRLDVNNKNIVELKHFSKFMDSLYSGSLEPAVAESKAREIGIDLSSSYFVVLNAHINLNENFSISDIFNCILSLNEKYPDTYWSYNNTSHMSVLIKGDNSKRSIKYASLLAESIKNILQRNFMSDCSIKISSCFNEINEITNVLYRPYEEINQGQSYLVYDIDNVSESKDAIPNFDTVKLIKRLQFAEAEEVDEIVHEVESKLESNGVVSVLYRYYVLVDIIRCANAIHNKNELSYGDLKDIFKASYSAKSFNLYLRNSINNIVHFGEKRNSMNRHYSVIQKACGFINEQYHNPDLSLKMVASHVAFSPTHFSTVFSQQMNKTFIEYLTEVRIEKAKEFLVNTDEKLTNISLKIGYNEPNYFSYLFKKRVGIPPKEYRRLNIRESLIV